MKIEIKQTLLNNKLFLQLFQKQIKFFTIKKTNYNNVFCCKLKFNNNCDNNLFFDKQLIIFQNDIEKFTNDYFTDVFNLIDTDVLCNTFEYSNGIIIIFDIRQ